MSLVISFKNTFITAADALEGNKSTLSNKFDQKENEAMIELAPPAIPYVSRASRTLLLQTR